MNITSVPPSPETQAMLEALQAAVAKSLARKQKLGQYAVVWEHGRPIQSGADAPTQAASKQVSQPVKNG